MRVKSSPRAGYALMLALVFIILFMALLGVAYRETASALRTESVRSLQVQRDEGTIHALARGLTLLETGKPPTTPYLCGVIISTSTGPRTFTVTFVSEGGTNWSVQSAPTLAGDTPPPMPSTFGPG